MPRPDYRELIVKSALNQVHGMPFGWSLNPYRGCAHSCHYCYARATHTYFNLGVGSDFTDIIFCKTNVAQALAGELARRSWKREAVAVGTATDPYQPVEGRYRLTRGCLEVLARYRTPASIVTKGTMAVRDIDLLQELTRRAAATVCFSVPTIDRDVWRRVEPGTAPPQQRLRAMQRLVQAGINAGVLMAPLLPDLSATREFVQETVRAAADHGACFVGLRVLNLDPKMRDYFFGFLANEYPQLIENYRRLYQTKYAPKHVEGLIEERVRDAKAGMGFRDGPHYRAVATPYEESKQLALL